LQRVMPSLPYPSRWGLSVEISGRPVLWGVLIIDSVTEGRVIGTVNFRGTPIRINGTWNENAKQLFFDSPYASYSGQLQIFDDTQIKVRHLILSGRFIMKPPSSQAGVYGNWIATTDKELTGTPINTGALPPVGAFLTSDLLYGTGPR